MKAVVNMSQSQYVFQAGRKAALTMAQKKKAIVAYEEVKKIANIPTDAAMARICKITPETICAWKSLKTPIAPAHCYTFEKLTGGLVKKSRLRPDIFKD